MAGTGGRVMVLPVRVLGRCGGYDSDIIAGMRWAAGVSRDPVLNPHPARVINVSLGSQGSCDFSYQDLMAELTAAKVTVVAAAGNDIGLAVGVPANCPGVIAVTGLRHDGTKAGYSSLGPEATISAPAGNCVNTHGLCMYPLLTTTNTGATDPAANTYSDAYNASLGTSFASPIVAGTVALMLSVDSTLTPARIRSILRSTARAFPTSGGEAGLATCQAPSSLEQDYCYCTTSTCGAGMLNAAAAVTLVKTPNAVPVLSDSDRVFNYLEAAYPQYTKPTPAVSANGSGYYYRYYASTGVYVGTLGGNVYYLIPTESNQVELLGSLAQWLAIAAAAGY
jgi:serine protease